MDKKDLYIGPPKKKKSVKKMINFRVTRIKTRRKINNNLVQQREIIKCNSLTTVTIKHYNQWGEQILIEKINSDYPNYIINKIYSKINNGKHPINMYIIY